MSHSFVGKVEYINAASNAGITMPAYDLVAGQTVSVEVGWENGGADDPATISIVDTAGNTSADGDYVLAAVRASGTAQSKKAFIYVLLNAGASQAGNVTTISLSAARDSRQAIVKRFTSTGIGAGAAAERSSRA